NLLALPASDGHSIQEIDLTTGKVVRRFRGQFGAISALAFSPDDTYLISGSGNVEDGNPGQQRPRKSNTDTTIRVWNSSTAELVKALPGHAAAVASLAVSEDGTQVISGDVGGVIKIWDLSTGRVVGGFEMKASKG